MSEDLTGTILNGRYRLERLLGHGAMGAVYLASDVLRDARQVALKLLLPERSRPAARERLRSEFYTLTRLRHPNLVGVHDLGVDRLTERSFLTLEYIDGYPLSARPPGAKLDLVELAVSLLRALDFIHASGFVHADIKPENILIERASGQPRIADFGLAGALGAPGTLRGTLPYTAPEVLKGDPPAAAADLYSLGATLYAAVAGHSPFDGDTPEAVIQNHLRGEFPFPAEVEAVMPSGLPLLIRRLLARDRAARPGSGADVINALADLSGKDLPVETRSSRALRLMRGPLVGRETELRAVDEALRDLTGDGVHGVLVFAGNAGVGKSRLVEETRVRAQMESLTVLVGRCQERDGRPFGAGVDILQDARSLFPERPTAGLDALLAAPGGGAAEISDRTAVLEAAADALRICAGEVPLVVILEDLHLAGPDLLALVAHWTRGLRDHPVLFLLTARDDGRSPALDALLEELEREPTTRHIRLGPLAGSPARDLVAALLGGPPPDDAVVDTVLERATGNPLLVAELLRTYIETGVLEPRAGGEWCLDPTREARSRVSGNLAGAAMERIDRLPAASRDLLQLLAVAGPAGRVAILGSVTESAAADVTLALQRLADVDLVTLADNAGGACRITHSFVRDALYERLSATEPDRCRELHQRLSDALQEEARDSNGASGELAFHLEASGQRARAAAAYLTAATQSQRRAAFGTALDDYRRAIALLEESGSASRVLAEAVESMADVHRLAGRLSEAEQAYARALDLEAPERTPVQRAELRRKYANTLNYAGKFDAALASAREALEIHRAAGDAAGEAACLNAMGVTHARRGEHQDAENHYGAALAIRRRLDQPAEVAGSLANLGMVAFFQGRREEGRQYLEEGLTLAESCHSAGNVALISNNLGLIATEEGRVEEAGRLIEKAEAAYRETGSLRLQAQCLVNLARLALFKGDYRQVVGRASLAVDLYQRLGMHADLANAHQLAGDAQRECGRLDAALEAHERALARARQAEDVRQQAFVLVAEALDHIASGDRDGADRCLSRAAGLVENGEEPRLLRRLGRARAAGELATGQAEDADARLSALLADGGEDDDPLEATDLRLARARARITLAQFEDALEDLEQTEELISRTGTTVRAWEMERLRSRCLMALGRKPAADAARVRAVDALAELLARLPDDLRSGLESTPAVVQLRIDAGGSESSRVTPTRFLDTMYEVIEALISSTDQQLAMDKVLDLAVGLLGAERGLVVLFPESGAEPRIAAARNIESETIADAVSYSYRVIEKGKTGQSLVSADASTDPQLQDFRSISRFGIKSVICVPMRSHDRVLGTVYLDSRSRTIGFDQDDLGFLEALGQHAATALDNMRMMRALQKENLTLKQTLLQRYSFGNIVGASQPMKDVFETLQAVSGAALPVLVQGESGTGKELVARALHYNGPRKEHPFLSENCAAFPETLLETELFGHVRGAFTGASTERRGLFQEADGGTLFLDEIGEMSAGLQARLTRVLETGELRPVGANYSVTVDVRVIAATHRDLETMVAEGKFRRDLLYRLNVITVDLPPLRDRAEDIPLLVSHFLDELSRELKIEAPGIEDDALEILGQQQWPGNVRQLRNEISRLLVLRHGDAITASDVLALQPASAAMSAEYDETGGEIISLREVELRHIVSALKQTDGDRTRAARLLGVGRATIFRKIKEYKLDV